MSIEDYYGIAKQNRIISNLGIDMIFAPPIIIRW